MALRVSFGTLTIAQNADTSGTMALGGAERGLITMPNALSGTTLFYHVSSDGATYRRLTNASGAVVPAASVAGSLSYPLPSELFGAHSFFLTAGTIQAAARQFIVSLKGGD